MDRRGTVLQQCLHVSCGAIPLMLLESVLRIRFRQGAHECVTDNFGYHACGGDRQASRVAADNRLRAIAESGYGVPVHEDDIRRRAKISDGSRHCRVGRIQDIQAINFRDVGRSCSDFNIGTAIEQGIEGFAA